MIELPFEYAVDGQWYSQVDVRSDDVYTPGGDPIGTVSDFRIITRAGEPPYPPSEIENRCNGRTLEDTACKLSYNWGRNPPVEVNSGRCDYHKEQPISDEQATPPGSEPPETQAPYGGTPVSLPGEVDASHFDFNGYHDTTTERQDSSGFRPDIPVDIESPERGGTGDGSIGYIESGEWWEYTVSIPIGTYEISLFVASNIAGSALRVSVDSREIGTVSWDTGSWYNWAEERAGQFTVEESGEHVIRIEAVRGALNWDRFVLETVEPVADGGYAWDGFGGDVNNPDFGYGE